MRWNCKTYVILLGATALCTGAAGTLRSQNYPPRPDLEYREQPGRLNTPRPGRAEIEQPRRTPRPRFHRLAPRRTIASRMPVLSPAEVDPRMVVDPGPAADRGTMVIVPVEVR